MIDEMPAEFIQDSRFRWGSLKQSKEEYDAHTPNYILFMCIYEIKQKASPKHTDRIDGQEWTIWVEQQLKNTLW